MYAQQASFHKIAHTLFKSQIKPCKTETTQQVRVAIINLSSSVREKWFHYNNFYQQIRIRFLHTVSGFGSALAIVECRHMSNYLSR